MAATQSPLPALGSSRVRELGWDERSDHYIAYRSAVQAERRASQLLADAEVIQGSKARGIAAGEANGKLISARVTGYMLLELAAQSRNVGLEPSAQLVKWLISQPQNLQNNRDDVIFETGTLLREKFIRVFRTTTTRYPLPSSHPSRASFDTLQQMIKVTMESTGKDYITSRSKALTRDGYRCVVTGIFNTASLKRCPQLSKDPEPESFILEAAHIFNGSAMQGIEDTQGTSSNKTHTASSAPTILRMFGFSKLADAFAKEGGVHEVWNMIMLEHNLHSLFDSLELWFEHTDKPHRYKVCMLSKGQEKTMRRMFAGADRNIDGAPTFVEFDTQFEEAPPPDPLLLALHATCARVAHMSGAAEFFDRIERDAEETRVLAFDGSSAPLLSDLLFPHAVYVFPAVHGQHK